MSTTRMMILGLIRWLQPVHGYDVRRELLSWKVEDWANIQPGSIYHALRKLNEEGMLAEVATEQVGGRPARTTYRMTPKGEAEFYQLLHQHWWEHRSPVDPFLGAMAFLPSLSRREAVAALRNRARILRAHAAGLRELLAAEGSWTDRKPVHVQWMFELNVERAAVEADWCERTADRIEAGEGEHVGRGESEPPTVADWRRVVHGEPDPGPSDSSDTQS